MILVKIVLIIVKYYNTSKLVIAGSKKYARRGAGDIFIRFSCVLA